MGGHAGCLLMGQSNMQETGSETLKKSLKYLTFWKKATLEITQNAREAVGGGDCQNMCSGPYIVTHP